MSAIEDFLKAARDQLIDATPKNRFLNYKQTKRRSISISSTNPLDIYKAVVIEERAFRPLAQVREEPHLNEDGIPPKEIQELDGAEAAEAERGPLTVHTDHEREDLIRRLTYCSRDARSILEEQGYNALYLALFFLRWSESPDQQDKFLAPLLLVPVRLERSFAAGYQARWTREEVEVNESLRLKLFEQHIELPPFDNYSSLKKVKEYIRKLTTSVQDRTDWTIDSAAYLDFFNFTKTVMWKDLDPRAWPSETPSLQHPVLAKLCGSPQTNPPTERFDENEVDTRLKLHETYYVMDADPSQIAVIEDVKAGHDLVVEGPPGTGKSQTIVNIIGEVLAQHKKVLFVSEKLAALEVVKKRLDEVGLGDFCLELHSRKANKKDFYQEMKKALDLQAPDEVAEDGTIHNLEVARKRLNGYVSALTEPFGALGKSPFDLFCMREKAKSHFARGRKDEPDLEFHSVAECTRDSWDAAISALEEMRHVLKAVGTIPEHPFFGCDLSESGDETPVNLGALIVECRAAGEKLQNKILEWQAKGLSPSDSWEAIPALIRASDLLCRAGQFRPLDRELLTRHDHSLAKSEAISLIREIEQLQERKSELQSTFRGNAFRAESDSLLEQSKLLLETWQMLFRPIRHWKLTKEVFAFYRTRPTKALSEVAHDLEALADYLKSAEELEALVTRGRSLFGIHWRAENSDCQKLRALWNWLESLQSLRRDGVILDAAIDMCCSRFDFELLQQSARELQTAWTAFSDSYSRLTCVFQPNYEKAFGKPRHETKLSDLISRLSSWELSWDRLHEWSVYMDAMKRLSATMAGTLAPLIELGHLRPDDLIPAFTGKMAGAILKMAMRDRKALNEFLGQVHEGWIERFAEADSDLPKLNRKRLAHKLFTLRPPLPNPPPRGNPLAILKAQILVKKLTIRQIFSRIGRFLQELKPCTMMSPLSVAQFLEPGKVHFDLVIFDEASQVEPADGLGAIFRGEHLVVIGDSKQLPPTDFFHHVLGGVDDEDGGEDDPPLNVFESLLDLCRLKFGDPGQLKWHYRSKHESLIAVSNQEFYDNKLKIYPSPISRNEQLGLRYVRVPDGKYDKGKSRTNIIEAQAVAHAVLDHCRSNGHVSLGVGTFNEAQRECVLDELEKMREEHAELKEYLKSDSGESLFVKNLETIQGDERDIILISIGYGFDRDGKLSLNFGPLNQQGGERRLNVLISRARQKCVVFANFSASDLKLGHTASRGVQALRVFLEYAETGTLSSLRPSGFGSPFEKAVHDFLAQKGIETHPQVGAAGYRIDLGVSHPRRSGHYVLGIECDGRMYHSSTVARERDRLRSQVLKDRGWKLYRVWSTDWYHNRHKAEESLWHAVESALEKAARQNEHGEESALEQLESEGMSIPFETDIRIPLLMMIYDNSEEFRTGAAVDKLTNYVYWASPLDDQGPVWSHDFGQRVNWALNDLTRNGYLKSDDSESWTMTDKGRDLLAKARLI
jgi:hypothetical protein